MSNLACIVNFSHLDITIVNPKLVEFCKFTVEQTTNEMHSVSEVTSGCSAVDINTRKGRSPGSKSVFLSFEAEM